MAEVLRQSESPAGNWRPRWEILDAVMAGDVEAVENLAVAHVRVAGDTFAVGLEWHENGADQGRVVKRRQTGRCPVPGRTVRARLCLH